MTLSPQNKTRAPKLSAQHTQRALEGLLALKNLPNLDTALEIPKDRLKDLLLKLDRDDDKTLVQTLRDREVRQVCYAYRLDWSESRKKKTLALILQRLPPAASHLALRPYVENPGQQSLRAYLWKSIEHNRGAAKNAGAWRTMGKCLLADRIDGAGLLEATRAKGIELRSIHSEFGLLPETPMHELVELAISEGIALTHIVDEAREQREWLLDWKRRDEAAFVLARRIVTEGSGQAEVFYPMLVETLGDPREPENQQTWQRVGEHHRKAVVRFLAEREVHAFFTTLQGDADRLSFWKSQTPRMHNAQALIDGVAIAMFIGKEVYVEFLEVGNAIYIYTEPTFASLLRQSPRVPADLKDKDRAVDKMTHRGQWQPRVRARLNRTPS